MPKTFQGRTFLDPAKFLQQNRLHMLALLLRDADMRQSVATLVSPFDTSAEEGPLSAVAMVDTALPPHAEASLSTLLSDSRVGSTLDEMGQARSNAPAVTDVHFEGTLLPVWMISQAVPTTGSADGKRRKVSSALVRHPGPSVRATHHA